MKSRIPGPGANVAALVLRLRDDLGIVVSSKLSPAAWFLRPQRPIGRALGDKSRESGC